MPNDLDQVPVEDDADEDYISLLKSTESPPGKQKFGKAFAVPPSSSKPQDRASTVVSPFESISASTSVAQSPQPSINELAIFVDEHLQTDTLEEWFTNFSASFNAQIFPQFFIKSLSNRFSELLSQEEAYTLTQNYANFGDLNNPSIRDIVYNAQSELLYKTLQNKITKRPSLIYEFIAALRFNNWYHPVADKFESELNKWKKNKEDTLNATTPAFVLPSPAAPRPAVQINPNGQMSVVHTIPMPVPLQLSQKPNSLLVNLPEPLSFFISRKSKETDLIAHLNDVSKKGKVVEYSCLS